MSLRLSPTQPQEAGTTFNKPVSALAIVPVNRSLTVTARKIYNVMGRLAQSSGDTREEGYAAPLHAILHQSGTDSSATASAKRYLKEMMTTIIEWRQLSPGDVMPGETEREQVFTLLSQADFYKVGRENWVRWWYPPAIKRQMLDPERWAQINLETVARLGTYCAVALYEICARYQGVGRTMRQDWTWWLPVLRGTDQSKLREWRKFKNEFVAPAVRNINELSEIEIELVEHKKNGKFSGEVQFLVRRKDKAAAALMEAAQPVDVTAQAKALALEIREHDFDALVLRYGEQTVARALETLAQHVAQARTPIANRLAHLKWILAGVADKPPPSPTRAALPRSMASTPMPAAAAAPGPSLQAGPTQEELVEAEQAFAALPREEQFRWLQRLREDLAARGVQLTPLLRARLDAGQWQAPAVRSWLLRFYARQRQTP